MSGPPPRRGISFLFWLLMALIVLVIVALVVNNDAGRTFGLDNEEFGQLGYLVVLLLFLGSALIGRRLRAGEVVRSMLVWVVILSVLVGVYAYREELLGVGGRFIGVLVPGVPIAGRLAGGDDESSVVIVRAGAGHFVVRATVEEVPLTLLVDTGASFVTLTPADATRVGIDVGSLRFATPIRTANGVIQAAPITIGRLSVGAIERRGVSALVAPPDTLDQSLLGLSFLDTLTGYGINGDRLILTP